MATYVVGDIQGCLEPFQRLLKAVDFKPQHDRLWLLGDLINRGPESLASLRFIDALGDAAQVVLGNHDLYLLAAAAGCAKEHPGNTFHDILQADDADYWFDWLRRQPLMQHDAEHDVYLLHAGLPAHWDARTAMHEASAVEALLQQDDWRAHMPRLFGNQPNHWQNGQLHGWDRWRYTVNALTRIRFCHADGSLDFKHKGGIKGADADHIPWFAMPQAQHRQDSLIFGHWSALKGWRKDKRYGLDTGCVWGGKLTALCLDRPGWPWVQVAA